MRELTDIVAAHAALAAEGKPCALATVVNVEGSAYRRPGARMLIAEDGRTWGGVSGGCLERDVAARARGVIASGRSFLARYDTATEEAVERGVSTGCGGTIDVLLQPVFPDAPGPLAVLATVLSGNRPRVLATVVRATGSWQSLVGEAEDVTDLVEGAPPLQNATLPADARPPAGHRAVSSLMAAAADVSPALSPASLRTSTLHLAAGERRADVFLARVVPPQRLVLVGGGPDVVPVVRIAKTLGWRVAVVATRPGTTLHERFADADERYVTGPDAPLEGVPVGPADAVIVMTHNLFRDAAALAGLGVRPRFLGVLGPQHRSDRLLATLPADHPARGLRSPVGLDLGADTPEEIALSIVAGVQAALRSAPGGSLSDRAASKSSPATPANVPNAASPTVEPACPA